MDPVINTARGGATRRLAFLIACALGACAGLHANTPAQAAAANAPTVRAVPSVVASGEAHRIAALTGDRRLKLAISLPLRNQAELDALVHELYDPASPTYRHYLSVAEFTDRFGASQADYAALVQWASAQGFTVTSTTSNRHIVDVEGSVDTINRALHVNMTAYRHPTEGRAFFAADRTPTLDLSVPVLAITGLDDFSKPAPRIKYGTPEQIAAAVGPNGNAGGSGPSGNFMPSDMRAAYYGTGPLTGAGQTVGIFSFEPYKHEDVTAFYALTGATPVNVPIHDVLVNGASGVCGTGCDDGEQILDIVNVAGMAPGIEQMLFYVGDSGPDILNRMATDNIAQVLSCSWGSTDMGAAADPIFQEFQAQGQSFVSATGDDGRFNAQTWAPPSLNPHILEVGGTHLATSTPGGPWASESSWSGSGGGFYAPAGWAIPDYQQTPGVINASNQGSTAQRNDPDVSAEGDFDNPTVSNGHLQLNVAGTSYAAPRWAGYLALANQQAAINSAASIGFINNTVYTIGTGAQYAANFHDVTSGSNGFPAVAGYDLVTGWGSPNASLLDSLAVDNNVPSFVLSAAPSLPQVERGTSVQIAIAVTPANGFSDDVAFPDVTVPSGVTATFSPTSSSTGTTLTLAASSSAALGAATITVLGNAGAQSHSTILHAFVGTAPSATVTPGALAFDHVVPNGTQDRSIAIANGQDSLPLTFTASAHSASCTDAAPAWLVVPPSGSAEHGETSQLDITVKPHAATLAPGDYTAQICLATNDPANATVTVPVTLEVVAPPAHDTVLRNGFDDSSTGAGLVVFTLDQGVDDSQAGSALNFATGDYHLWSSAIVDNINLYDDSGNGLAAYFYDDQVGGTFANKVGGVVAGGDYAVLQSGATIGPDSTISHAPTDMTNWIGGTEGYLGVAFVNSQTHALNYGYIHLQTAGPEGFPAQVIDYGFDDTGAAVTIP